MKNKYLDQIKAYIHYHQLGTDPGGYIAKLERICNMNVSDWDGKLPAPGKFKLDAKRCKVVESTKQKPIIPWWWYMDQEEPVPSVVEGIYNHIIFNYAIIYPIRNIWIYIIVEPSKKDLEIIKNQKNLRAFIMMSLINKNINPKERHFKRLRLGKLLNSNEIKKVLTFVAYSENYEFKDSVPKQIPVISSFTGANCTHWKLNYPEQKQVFSSLKDLIDLLFK